MTDYGRYNKHQEELKHSYNAGKERRKKLLAEVRKRRAKAIREHERTNTTK